MLRSSAIASIVLIVASALHAASPDRAPDFWYVVPDERSAANPGAQVEGIVVPSAVTPTVETTPAGSVISWRRTDGTRRSFVVQGVPTFSFAPGPLKGTTYVPFGVVKNNQSDVRSGCCSCASFENSRESVEALSCVPGCQGCGCEGCICSPYPCLARRLGSITLAAHGVSAPVMTFDRLDGDDGIKISGRGKNPVRFRGRHLSAELTANGETVISNPDSIAMSGRVTASAAVRGEKALFAWTSPDASVILEQPGKMSPPSFGGGTIELNRQPTAGLRVSPVRPIITPVFERCSACGTHPNSESDLDIYDCVPGYSVCYRCVSWEC